MKSDQVNTVTGTVTKESQHAYLKAMGIDTWVLRNPVSNLAEKKHLTTSALKQSGTSNDKNEEHPVNESDLQRHSLSQDSNPVKLETYNWENLEKYCSECTACKLSQNRQQTVFASGNQDAKLMIISDAPLKEDDISGKLFSGKSGLLLDSMLKSINLNRENVLITTLVKCSPANKREPTAEECEACRPVLEQQIALVKPEMIIAFGAFAGQRLLNISSNMNRLRGVVNFTDETNIATVVTYHPEYLLRAQKDKRKAWEDLQLVMNLIEQKK